MINDIVVMPRLRTREGVEAVLAGIAVALLGAGAAGT